MQDSWWAPHRVSAPSHSFCTECGGLRGDFLGLSRIPPLPVGCAERSRRGQRRVACEGG